MSNLEFRYQIIISWIKFRKGFAKFIILIPYLRRFLVNNFLRVLARCSSNTDELRDIDSIG